MDGKVLVGLAQALRHPELNDGLSWDTKTLRFLIQGMDHPYRKIHVDALL
jgi:hypothetical protein